MYFAEFCGWSFPWLPGYVMNPCLASAFWQWAGSLQTCSVIRIHIEPTDSIPQLQVHRLLVWTFQPFREFWLTRELAVGIRRQTRISLVTWPWLHARFGYNIAYDYRLSEQFPLTEQGAICWFVISHCSGLWLVSPHSRHPSARRALADPSWSWKW